MSRISIIVPVYNSDKYLSECIDSILIQSYKDFEILCIDDGSTDNSGKICDYFSKKDPRVRVVHKQNEGLVSARKTGVKNALGSYISFIDSDDWVDPDLYENLYKYAAQYDCDMVCSGIYRQFDDRAVINMNTIKKGIYEGEALTSDLYPYMLCDGRFFKMGVRPNLVGKLIKKEILEKTLFSAPEDVTNGEDVMVTYPSLLISGKVSLLDDAWYHYRQHPQSMSQKKADKKEYFATRHLYDYLKQWFEKSSEKEMLVRQLRFFISHFQVQREPEAFDEKKGQLRMFGEISPDDKLLLYGAGRFGKQVYAYLTDLGRDFIWTDKQFKSYQEKGLPLEDVNVLFDKCYDLILVAVIDSEMADNISRELIEQGVEEKKIRRLDVNYITDDGILAKMGFV